VTRPGAQREAMLQRSLRSMELAIAVAAAAGFVAYALASGHRLVATVASLVPIAAWLLAWPVALLVPLGLSIPDLHSLTGGRGGFNLSISDVLLVLAGAGILLEAATAKSLPAVRALRPVFPAVIQYSLVMGLLLFFHFGAGNFAKTGQRFELFLLPLLVGAYAALKGKHMRLLEAYVVASTVLAVAWPFHDFGLQKNPVGQIIANAILLLVGVPALRRLLPFLVVLVPGLFLTESRGAIIAAAIGVVVIVVMHGLRERSGVVRGLVLAALAIGAFAVMPAALRERVTTLSASQETRAGYAIYFRDLYSKDAKRIIAEHPWTGVGIGNYREADRLSVLPIEDPHQVILFQAAEGGYVLAASFVVLVAGTFLALRRMRRVDVGVAAAAVLLSTVAHGMVDIYWVRGTPLLGWLLVGMACGGFALRRQREAAPA
jgi:hypothetical protein